MSDNREILRTTFLKGMVPARIRNQDAVDTYETTILELQKLCGSETASLFAEPVRPTKPDPANPQMTWYTPLDGQMLDLATIDEVARRPVISLLRRRLEQLKPALNDPNIGATVASWLNITSTGDLLSVGGNPVLINWGYLPEEIAKSGIRREAHFTETVQRYAPELQRPPFTLEETVDHSERLRNKPKAPVTPEAASAAAPASAAAAMTETEAPVARRRLRAGLLAPMISIVIAAIVLGLLLIPGVLIRPNDTAAREELRLQTELITGDNQGLEERALALESQSRERVCRMPDGKLAPLPPLPGQPAPTNLTPRPDLLAPPSDRVQVPPPAGSSPGGQPNTLNALLDDAVVLVVVKSADGLSQGTGFYVSSDRIVTNRHVVLGMLPNSAQVLSRALGQAIPARVEALSAPPNVESDPSVPDFALLSVTTPAKAFLTLGPSPPKSTPVVADGYPGFLVGDDLLTFLRGESRTAPDSVVQQGTIIQRRDSDPVKYLTHSAPLGHGNSGGPLVDLCGRVVGVNTRVLNEGELATTANLAQDVTELRTFLERNGVTPKLDLDQKQCPPAVIPPGPTAQASPPAAAPGQPPAAMPAPPANPPSAAPAPAAPPTAPVPGRK